ncbi:hypothetical protein FUAX_29590 [Fulvitalea axinellae]|uniref:Uncharacterized protein n=1 Tax=Fulvitalea axinellae TaxID=1182444 RepID=A0AAU9CRB6_9BACT|nr:hypothetical protein FUAX_29590 [Fulvitalea axinellae]
MLNYFYWKKINVTLKATEWITYTHKPNTYLSIFFSNKGRPVAFQLSKSRGINRESTSHS